MVRPGLKVLEEWGWVGGCSSTMGDLRGLDPGGDR